MSEQFTCNPDGKTFSCSHCGHDELEPGADCLSCPGVPELTAGRKFDGDKPRYSLLPPKALRWVAQVLTYGAKKYSPDNWKHVPDGEVRYLDAAMRHIEAFRMGEISDPETGLPHLAHAVCCLFFLMEGFLEYREDSA